MYGWALAGIALIAVGLGYVIATLSLVVIPLVLALFPAAVLAPVSEWMKRRGMPDALAALVTVLWSLALLVGVFALLTPAVAGQVEGLRESAREGVETVRNFLEAGPFGLDPIPVEELLERAREQLAQTDGLGQGVLSAAVAVAQGLAGTIFALVALFFYLKDGARIAAWLRDLFPEGVREDAAEVGRRSWETIGGYIRGQLMVALVDAIGIAIGLLVIGVPLVLPLAVLVFLGGLFPIVGAVVSGAVAVLVALATVGLPAALATLAVVVAVQQLESNILQPVIMGRVTALHPLAVITALTAGGVLLGILGAFLAVPIAASIARAAGYLRARVPG